MLRGEVWPTLVSENESQFKKIESQYPHFLKKISPFQSEIATDISRTFPAHPKFVNNEKGQMELFRVLKAYSNYDSQIGYCQVNYSIALRHQKSREKLILIGKKGNKFHCGNVVGSNAGRDCICRICLLNVQVGVSSLYFVFIILKH